MVEARRSVTAGHGLVTGWSRRGGPYAVTAGHAQSRRCGLGHGHHGSEPLGRRPIPLALATEECSGTIRSLARRTLGRASLAPVAEAAGRSARPAPVMLARSQPRSWPTLVKTRRDPRSRRRSKRSQGQTAPAAGQSLPRRPRCQDHALAAAGRLDSKPSDRLHHRAPPPESDLWASAVAPRAKVRAWVGLGLSGAGSVVEVAWAGPDPAGGKGSRAPVERPIECWARSCLISSDQGPAEGTSPNGLLVMIVGQCS